MAATPLAPVVEKDPRFDRQSRLRLPATIANAIGLRSASSGLAGINSWPADAGSLAGRSEPFAAISAVLISVVPWIGDPALRNAIPMRMYAVAVGAALLALGVSWTDVVVHPELSLAGGVIVGVATVAAWAAGRDSTTQQGDVTATFTLLLRRFLEHGFVVFVILVAVMADIAWRRPQ